ncbi:DUF2238 domain-containing protein [Marinicella sp. W31]|uniref:DUF2238 domain-containing protein n=1 Tax=Marinicella sp. W31 TaxID=3023713 RepID=UPI00375744FB
MGKKASHYLPFVLILVFGIEFVILGIQPHDRYDWLLENFLVLMFVLFIGILWIRKIHHFSNTSWIAITLFLLIHEIGAHYTYSEVPYRDFFVRYLHVDVHLLLGWERNHFDRIVHFLFGLLLFIPMYELCKAFLNVQRYWIGLITFSFILCLSTLYELLEWAAALVFGGELGMAYLGTQGDIWDAHKDMLLAIIGAGIAWCLFILRKKVVLDSNTV